MKEIEDITLISKNFIYSATSFLQEHIPEHLHQWKTAQLTTDGSSLIYHPSGLIETEESDWVLHFDFCRGSLWDASRDHRYGHGHRPNPA